ncbi:MAG TPA: hypothetical protein VGE45_00390 [Chloroflexia bacterium]|jgi:hypothetical protein
MSKYIVMVVDTEGNAKWAVKGPFADHLIHMLNAQEEVFGVESLKPQPGIKLTPMLSRPAEDAGKPFTTHPADWWLEPVLEEDNNEETSHL